MPSANSLRVPQARVLAALVPVDPDSPDSEWPLISRAQLAVRAGYTAISGSVTRALNGIKEGSSSGASHSGLIAMGYVQEVSLDIDGVEEVNYCITVAGIQAYQAYIEENGDLPKHRSAEASINKRYKNKERT